MELFLLDRREVWAAQEGWLIFDLTATSNHWLVNPEQNLGLHLVLEDRHGQSLHTLTHIRGGGPHQQERLQSLFRDMIQ